MKKLQLIAILAIVLCMCSCTSVKDNQIKYTIDLKKVCEIHLTRDYDYEVEDKDNVSLEKFIAENLEEEIKKAESAGLATSIIEHIAKRQAISTQKIEKDGYVYNVTLTYVRDKLRHIPDELFSLGGGGSSYITGVELPSSITYIGRGAFRFAYLTEITLPSGVIEIGDDAFCECEHLKSVIIPSSVRIIGDDAFWRCVSLENIDISNVKEIGQDAFWRCDKLPESYKTSINSNN